MRSYRPPSLSAFPNTLGPPLQHSLSPGHPAPIMPFMAFETPFSPFDEITCVMRAYPQNPVFKRHNGIVSTGQPAEAPVRYAPPITAEALRLVTAVAARVEEAREQVSRGPVELAVGRLTSVHRSHSWRVPQPRKVVGQPGFAGHEKDGIRRDGLWPCHEASPPMLGGPFSTDYVCSLLSLLPAGDEGHSPNHISKMVLPTVNLGPPNWTESRTFVLRSGLTL